MRTWKSKDIEDQQLRQWINKQRNVYRAGLLPECREKALYNIPGWRWADHEEPWMDMLKRMQVWLQETAAGEILDEVVQEKPDMDQHLFSTWLNQQRNGKRGMKHEHLSAYQVELMQALERTWKSGNRRNKQQKKERRYGQLAQYQHAVWMDMLRRMGGKLRKNTREMLDELLAQQAGSFKLEKHVFSKWLHQRSRYLPGQKIPLPLPGGNVPPFLWPAGRAGAHLLW